MGIMPTKIELTLEQSQQGVSNDVLLKSDSLPHAHAQTTKTYYKHQDSRIKKAQDLKTKTSANSDIQDLPSRYQDYQDNDYQGRLLASFQDDAKYEHVGQDTRSQGDRQSSSAISVKEFEKCMLELKKMNPKAHEWIVVYKGDIRAKLLLGLCEDSCTICQNLQAQLQELQCENDELKLSAEQLTKAREIVEVTLRQRDEMIFGQCEKLRLLEEQYEPFYEVQFEFDSEICLDTEDNSEKDLILSLQTQLKETAELVVCFSDEKCYALKEIESLKVEIKSLQTENKVLKSRKSELLEKIDRIKSQVSELLEKLQISNQEMKQQIVIFEKDKRIFLVKNEFFEKVSSSVQKEYNDLLASNDVLKQRL
ncbi:hypothetical protein Tco_0817530 [Tanacetum coccineum]